MCSGCLPICKNFTCDETDVFRGGLDALLRTGVVAFKDVPAAIGNFCERLQGVGPVDPRVFGFEQLISIFEVALDDEGAEKLDACDGVHSGIVISRICGIGIGPNCCMIDERYELSIIGGSERGFEAECYVGGCGCGCELLKETDDGGV